MQIYLKPYPHSTYTNVPYAPVKGTKNVGYFNVKKYPGKIKQIPELKNEPEMVDLIQKLNKESRFNTFGCDVGTEIRGLIFMKWSFVNLFFTNLDSNKLEGNYYDQVSKFINKYMNDTTENVIVEFIINPTNFHDFERFKNGVKPSEETVLFRGFSLNCKIIGAGVAQDDSADLWKTGIAKVGDFSHLKKHN